MINNLKSYLRDIKNYFAPTRHPFGKKIVDTKEYYINIFNDVRNKEYLEVDKYLSSKRFQINKNWVDNLALHTQVVKKKSPINYQHGRILYSCLREYIENSENKSIEILEIGTARGFSSVCMSKALNDSNSKGVITTIDIIANNLPMFWNCIDDHEGPKTRVELLSKWRNELKNIKFLTGPSRMVLNKINMQRINFAFVDGMHDMTSIKREFNFIKLRQKINDIIIFDDVSEDFPEIIKFIKDLKKLNEYKIEIISSDFLRSYAICKKI